MKSLKHFDQGKAKDEGAQSKTHGRNLIMKGEKHMDKHEIRPNKGKL